MSTYVYLYGLYIESFGNTNDLIEGERFEGVTGSSVELGVEFHPMKTDGVKESGKALHKNKDTDGKDAEETP